MSVAKHSLSFALFQEQAASLHLDPGVGHGTGLGLVVVVAVT